MKHPSRWPWVLRFPLCLAAILAVWMGPIALMWWGLSRWAKQDETDAQVEWVLGVIVLLGWSHLIMRTVVHRYIEPFFNIQSLQNKRDELFTPEPVHSFRDWLRMMFRGR